MTPSIRHPRRDPAAPTARAVLGADHPLARALELQTVLARDLLAITLLTVATASGLAALPRPAVAIAAAVACLLAAATLAARATVRGRARDLIAEGREDVPVAAVARECERLLGLRHRQMLARSLRRLRVAAEGPPPSRSRGTRPLHADTLRTVGPELRQLEALLGQPHGGARGVALARRLLVEAASPLRAGDPQRLREELRRISILLAASTLAG